MDGHMTSYTALYSLVSRGENVRTLRKQVRSFTVERFDFMRFAQRLCFVMSMHARRSVEAVSNVTEDTQDEQHRPYLCTVCKNGLQVKAVWPSVWPFTRKANWRRLLFMYAL